MGSSCAHYQNKMETKKTIFDDSLGENPWGNPKKTKNFWENQQKTIFGDSLGQLHWQNQKNLEKTKKTKNQNFSENVWSEAHVWFFWVLPWFFWFFLVLTWKKTKKTQGFFGFLDKMMVKELWKTKKTQGFFWFLGVCGFSFFLAAQWKTKKKPWVFLVFHNSLTIIWSKQPKKPWVFLVFSRSRPKNTKKTKAKPKKTKHEPQTKHSLKSFGFFVFWFSRGLVILYFLRFNPNHKNSKYKVKQLKGYEISREQIEGIIGSMWVFPFWFSFNGK